jgi:hypothetical protein
MEPATFDTLIRSLSSAGSRRRVLARMLGALPLAGALATLGDGREADAAHPAARIQKRRARRRTRARRRQDHQHELQTRDNGSGGNTGGDQAKPSDCKDECNESYRDCASDCGDDDFGCVLACSQTRDLCLEGC